MSETGKCIICHDHENLVKTPCSCKGSSGYIHQSCLQQLRNCSQWKVYCPQCKTVWRDLKAPWWNWRMITTLQEMQVGLSLFAVPLILSLKAMNFTYATSHIMVNAAFALLMRMFELDQLRSACVPSLHFCITSQTISTMLELIMYIDCLCQWFGCSNMVVMRFIEILLMFDLLTGLYVTIEVMQRFLRRKRIVVPHNLPNVTIPSFEDQEIILNNIGIITKWVIPLGFLIFRPFFSNQTVWKQKLISTQQAYLLSHKFVLPERVEYEHTIKALQFLPFPIMSHRIYTWTVSTVWITAAAIALTYRM